jgi:Homeodomain-like domain
MTGEIIPHPAFQLAAGDDLFSRQVAEIEERWTLQDEDRLARWRHQDRVDKEHGLNWGDLAEQVRTDELDSVSEERREEIRKVELLYLGKLNRQRPKWSWPTGWCSFSVVQEGDLTENADAALSVLHSLVSKGIIPEDWRSQVLSVARLRAMFVAAELETEARFFWHVDETSIQPVIPADKVLSTVLSLTAGTARGTVLGQWDTASPGKTNPRVSQKLSHALSQMRDRGLSVREIAALTGVSKSQVQRLLKEIKQADQGQITEGNAE